jgi:hypothetical protein
MKRLGCLLFAATLAAQNAPKLVPPPGIEVSAQDRAELQAGLDHLRASIAKLKNNPLLPDVLIYQEAVRFALEDNEFFKIDEIAKARTLLKQGEDRAAQLAEGQSPWTTATGLVVRGYISKIDRSVQPYGLVVPPSYTPRAPHRWRLDAWFHGRSETMSQVAFLSDRQRSPGEFQPRDTIVLHLYGRYCNASKFAGEVDFFEALDAVKRQYAIDENRILVRGFSMGGASVWHLAAHYGGLWAAASPGAGFAETAQYQKLKLTGDKAPPAWEQTLWHLYDATDYAANLYNLPIVTYHGEIDPQRQSSDVMERAMAAEGLRLIRVIGPQTAHKYHPDSKIEIERRLDAIAERGSDPYPRHVRFTTWTLAYNRMNWVAIDAMGKHWERARLNAGIAGDSAVNVETANVAAFTLEMGSGGCPLDPAHEVTVAIDGQKVTATGPMSDRSWTAHFRKTGSQWAVADSAEWPGLHKRHGLQGPIDDAFLDSFIFVSPTGAPRSEAIGKWASDAEKRAIYDWRRQFRGDAQVRNDTEITEADIANSNLVLWGDPGSNRVLARIADKLPADWSDPGRAPILIYPNPLNSKKYVVVNTGFTFAGEAATSNARQTPKLPDYAVIDVATGKVLRAGFFNEEWRM